MSTAHPYHIHTPLPTTSEYNGPPPNALADGVWRKPEEKQSPSVDGIGFFESPSSFSSRSDRKFHRRWIGCFLQTFGLNVKPTDSLWARCTKNTLALSILSLLAVALIFSLVEVVTLAALRGQSSRIHRHLPHSIRVAFVGNSITFVNDLPRLMEALSWNTIEQNSCLHGSLSFVTILSKGNGMYNKWKTTTAVLTDSSTTTPMYDFGACTVRQLLLGHDKYLTENNANGYYTDDGMNPCFQDDNYYEYLTDLYSTRTASSSAFLQWDYVVMNDQTVQPGLQRRRKRSLRSLRRVYAKLFNQTTTTIPVLLSTYGYDKSLYDDDDADDLDESDDDENDRDDDAYDEEEDEQQQQQANGNQYKNYNHNDDAIYSALGDVPEFTSRIWYGYQLYAQSLGKALPASQQPLVVPSALAFLLIWEENYSAWLMLFYEDGFHPSPHGTYLLGCCLYATLYHRMPPPPTYSWQESGSFSWNRRHSKYKGNDTTPMQALFSRARRMHTESMGNDRPYPTVEEAMYLYCIAERVVLKKAVPISLLSAETIAQMEAEEAAAG